MASEERKFDIRTLERNFDKGNVGRDEYAKHLEKLDDLADQAQPIEALFEEGVLDKDEDGEDDE
jgi:hypothetical protein